MAGFDQDVGALFSASGMTADQAAARAAQASPDVRRKVAELGVAIVAKETTSLQRVPFVQGKASYTRLSYIAPFEIPLGTMTIPIAFLQNSYDLVATTTVPISDYFVRYPRLMKSADQNIAAARLSEQSTAVNAGQDARLAFYEWVRARLQVLVAKRQLGNVQATLKQAQALADAQRLSKADLLRIESQEAEAEQTVDQLANLESLREEQLRLLIGAADSEPLAVAEDVRGDIAAPGSTSLDDLVKHASDHRLDLRTIDQSLVAKQAQYDGSEADLYPKLSVFATAEDARPNQRIFPQTDEFRFTWLAGVQVIWTLGDTLTAKTTRARVHAEAAELRADRENLVRGQRIELLSAQQAVSLAVHSLATSQKGLQAAEESYRVRRELLAADRATAVELVDSQTDLTRARIAALNARVDLRVALAQLAHALGDDASPPTH
jgi:cobalt-zinc-cadmium efflux system outer membrane protein